MDKIKVDYISMASKAKQIREYGKDFNMEISNVYKNISAMHNVWYGKRYNVLVNEFNSIVNSLNQLLKIVINKIPGTLEKIANNYSQADNDLNTTTVVYESSKPINNITVFNDVGMKFITSEVDIIQQKVIANLRNAKDKINKIETICKSITWQSESGNIFKSKVGRLKVDVVNVCNELNNEFTNLMNQAKEDIQRAEDASNID